MTKKELVANVAEKTGLKKSEVEKVIAEVNNEIVEAMKKDDKVAFLGFGTYSVSARSARESINPVTKEKIQIPARKVGKFKFSKAVNDQLL